MRTLPFDKAKLEEIAARWPTPFHIYDAKAIRENAKRLKKAFAWNRGFREYFAVKAAPNPHLMKLLREFDFGSDCSSMAELVLAEKVEDGVATLTELAVAVAEPRAGFLDDVHINSKVNEFADC